jgi:hypothetical protein
VPVCGGTSISVWDRCNSNWLLNQIEGCFLNVEMTETGRKTEDAVISIPAQEKKQIEPEERIETKGLLPSPYKDG